MELELRLLAEVVDRFLGDLGLDRCVFLPSGKQLVHRTRIEQSAAETVLSHLTCFLQHVYVLFADRAFGILFIVRVDQLREAKRASESGGPPPTMTTSASICGRSIPLSGLRKTIMVDPRSGHVAGRTEHDKRLA